MKRTIPALALLIGIFFLTLPATAQFGLDQFAVPRPIVLASPQSLTTALTTNGPIDTHGYIGVGTVLLTSSTNPYPAAVTNLSGLLPLTTIGITNLPATGNTLTITLDATNQVFIWTNNTTVGPVMVRIGASTAVSATNLNTVLTTGGYTVAQASPTVLLLTGSTNDTLLTAINSLGWGTNQNTTIYSVTNVVTAGAGTLTATLEVSSNTTDWTALNNYAEGVPTILVRTNLSSGSAVLATNLSLVPGVLTVPNAALYGYATPVLAPALFNNSGAITMGGLNVTEIAYQVSPTLGYLHVIWTATGPLTTNAAVSATFNGVKSQ
jgi:hypothetical protein